MDRNFSPIFRCNVEDGKLTLRNKELFDKYLLSLRGECEIIVRKWRKRRSTKQNAYYFGVVIPLLCEYFGYTDDEMHEALKIKFLSKEGVKLPTTRSTASLSTIEFEYYIAKIKQWALEENNLLIPEPGQVEY